MSDGVRRGRVVVAVLWLSALLLASLLVRFVYVAVRDESEADAFIAATQTALALATIALVVFTMRNVDEARRATEQTSRNSLLERLDARGPRVIVHFLGMSCHLAKDGETAESDDGSQTFALRDDDLADGYLLHVAVSFSVHAFGDAPAFAGIVPGSVADLDPLTMRAVVPNGNATRVNWTWDFRGEEIRELAAQGSWDRWKHWPFVKPVLSVTDATRTVEDIYMGPAPPWPFVRSDERLVVRASVGETTVLQAHRIYHPEAEILPTK